MASYGFDGINFGFSSSPSVDKRDLGIFVQEASEVLRPLGFLVTAHLSGGKHFHRYYE